LINHPHIEKLIAFLTASALFFSIFLMAGGFSSPDEGVDAASESLYKTKLFSNEMVIKVDIVIDENDLQWLYDNAEQETYKNADVTINGATFKMVGLRPKGNSSLKTVATSDEHNRFSFKIEFDTYLDGQTAYGLDKLVLNNMMSDATYMKEYLSYDLLGRMGIATPLYTFAQITINGENNGLYLMVESAEDSYLERQFGSTPGTLYKPEDDLVYAGDTSADYPGLFNYAETKLTKQDEIEAIELMKRLASSETNAQTLKKELEEVLNIDEVLRYFAVNTLLVNLDSYVGNFHHNYLLYEEEGRFQILPWDLNMSFGGFQSGTATTAVNFSIDSPYSGTASQVPLISKLLEIPEYRAQYEALLSEAVMLYFDSGLYTKTIDELNEKISSYVEQDQTAFYTFEAYEASLPALKRFGELRALSVKNQLADDFSEVTADFDLSALGSMGGLGGPGLPGGMVGNTGVVQGEQAGAVPMVPGNQIPGPDKNNFRPLTSLGLSLNQASEQQVMEIMRSMMQNGGVFTDENVKALKSIGLNDSQIETLKTSLPGRDTPKGGQGELLGAAPGGFDERSNALASNRPFDETNTAPKALSMPPDFTNPLNLTALTILLLGLAVVKLYRRR
jgi:hypothetical protein